MRIALFSYNFPHKKTQDFLLRLYLEGLVPEVVIAADPVVLNIPPPKVRVKPRHSDLMHPAIICKRLGIDYHVRVHNSNETCELLASRGIEIGLISGARILKTSVIQSVTKGIINIHPGLLPEVRGMDALQWSIYEGHKIGVTAHVIGERIDSGRILSRTVLTEYLDDTLVDLSLRLQETQTVVLTKAVRLLDSHPLDHFAPVDESKSPYRKMPPDLETQLPGLLIKRLAKLNPISHD